MCGTELTVLPPPGRENITLEEEGSAKVGMHVKVQATNTSSRDGRLSDHSSGATKTDTL